MYRILSLLVLCVLGFSVSLTHAAYIDYFRLDNDLDNLATSRSLHVGDKSAPTFQLDVTGGQIGIDKDSSGGLATDLSHSLAPGQCVYANGNDSVDLARANSTTTMPCMGITLENNQVLLSGFYDIGGFDAGKLIYVDAAAAGGFTDTVPNGNTDQVQAVGIAISNTTIYFNPSLVVFEIGNDVLPDLGGHLDLRGYNIFDSTIPGKIEFGIESEDGRQTDTNNDNVIDENDDPAADIFVSEFLINMDSTGSAFRLDTNGPSEADGVVFEIDENGALADEAMVLATSTITLSQTGETSLSSNFDAGTTSIIGALNELSATGGAYTTRTVRNTGTIGLTEGPVIAITTAGSDISLPACVGGIEGKVYHIKDESGQAGAGDSSVISSAGGNIDGAATFEIKQNYNSASFYCSGAQWFIY